MLKDYPYSTLKQEERSYEIMLLRDQHNNTFTDLAKEYELSVTRVVQKYYKIKLLQIRLYINHISVVLGHETCAPIRHIFHDACECYQDWTYACAYLEQKYKDILIAYRAGEPGMPEHFIKDMPPFKPTLSKKTIARVIEMREAEKATYTAIAKELRLTPAKARRTYDWFYHTQVLALIKDLQATAESREEKQAICDYYFSSYRTAKKRYDALMERY